MMHHSLHRQMIHDGEIQVHTSVVQHILSAATLPSIGMRSIERYIEDRFPRAKWISNQHLHKHHPRIVQEFHTLPYTSHLPEANQFLTPARMNIILRAMFNQPIPIDVNTDVDVSFDFLETMPRDEDDLMQPEVSTMIFVNTAEEAVKLATELRRRHVRCVEFHKLQMADDKQQGLRSFREGQVRVLVSTDSAARGLDLPNVRHVIQAEFAQNVVQHLHRIGRASRAGAMGKATNIIGRLNYLCCVV
jgi:superfamily II DNA/RNA helicase